ncbi:MAG: flexitail domain-containing putative surface protein [Dehalococcoidia bacterium]
MRFSRLLLAGVTLLVAGLANSPATQAEEQTPTTPNLKVAFIGDQGIGANATAVLNLIEAEGADMALHLGDLGYGSELLPQTAIDWDAQVTNVLGADFPYFAVIGNHDVGSWTTYQSLLLNRLAQIPGANCSGDYGVMASCTYQGLFFILSGAGTQPNVPDHQPHIDYITNALAQDNSIWRICAWHKNQTALQAGAKTNEVGWGPYEACENGRAIIATAHEHSYQRTRTLRSVEQQAIDALWPNAGAVEVRDGSTFAFVAGLAGQSIRPQLRCLPIIAPYGCNGEWASIYTTNQGANYGALFIEFNVDGDSRKANAYFKNITGAVVDSFSINAAPPPQPAPADTDLDGCTDEQEAALDEEHGGRRDYLNKWDFYDTDGNKTIDLFVDIFSVANAFGLQQGDPGYDPALDRSPPVSAAVEPDPTKREAWDMGPPSGTIDLFTDIFGAALQFGHTCA